MTEKNDRTRRVTASEASGGYRLVILAEHAFGTHPLPLAGRVTIGRASEADVIVHDPSISKLHAAVHVGPDGIRLEDLGSSNGTKLRGKPIAANAPVELALGEVAEVGSIAIVVQRVRSHLRPRRLKTHGYFEARLDEECARGEPFSLLRVRVDATAPQEPVLDALAAIAGPLDAIASYGPSNYEMLLVHAEREQAEEAVGALTVKLKGTKSGLRTGIAAFPADGLTPEELIATAEAPVRGSAGEPGGPIVLEPSMRKLLEQMERIAAGSIPVLLLGETGAGKEVLAEHLHSKSPRSSKRFVRVNCGAFPETLIESELFGHEKGAFTGAAAAKPGWFEVADGGTLFLDEVGELPAPSQSKLLRVLENGEVLRIGSTKPKTVDVRLVCATNRDLESDVAAGSFRRDLFFRIGGAVFSVPPLRERPKEIEALARAFVERAAKKEGRTTPALSPEAMALLSAYAWPGNVRELRNMMERAVLLCSGTSIQPEHLPVEKMSAVYLRPSATAAAAAEAKGATGPERERILDALTKTGGNQMKAAELLGMSRRTFVSRLEQFGIPRPRKGG